MAEQLDAALLDAIGRAVHEEWKRWRIRGGYPDHVFQRCYMSHLDEETLKKFPKPHCSHRLGPTACHVYQCERAESDHHPDMVDWEDLSPEKREKYIVQGQAGAGVERERIHGQLGAFVKCRVIHLGQGYSKMTTCLDIVEMALKAELDPQNAAYRYGEEYRRRLLRLEYLCLNCRIAHALGVPSEHVPYTTVGEARAAEGGEL